MAQLARYNTSDYTTGNAPLAVSASMPPITMIVKEDTSLIGAVASDQPGTLYIDQGFDGVNWDATTTYNVLGGTTVTISNPIIATQVRLRYVNGINNQLFMRLYARSL